ncbi:DUF4328 domain-containing protein [Streptomyces pactum]|uniref:DUF4328 domain-containing protein n=1 Tax=Streptomyces pactum TaxID=68249 RepID=A0ABS0NN60_9ACTN|nr:DUF4328 domain-containing protein [Streptomyces pactum]MBH5336527.1 DUF4328 domain-containing protein [Streptomyces pactum]
MYPCGSCHAAAVGPDGRCAACGTYQQQLQYPAGPPGYPAAPPIGMPAAGVDLRRGLATTLTVLFPVAILTLLLVLIARGGQYGAVTDFLDEPSPQGVEDLDEADDFYLGMSVINFLVQVPIIVVWVIWFRRLRLNAEVFAPGRHRFGSGWAAGSWFTPVVQFWFPKQIANDIWRASTPQGPQAVRLALLSAWWVAFVSAFGVGLVSSVMYAVAEDKADRAVEKGSIEDFEESGDALKGSLGLSMVSLTLLIVAAVLALLVIRQITRMQEQRAGLGPQPGGPAPYGPPGGPAVAGPDPYGQPGAAPYGQPGAAPYGQPAPGAQPGPYPPYGSGPAGH